MQLGNQIPGCLGHQKSCSREADVAISRGHTAQVSSPLCLFTGVAASECPRRQAPRGPGGSCRRQQSARRKGLESSAPLPGSKGAQIADVQASHIPILAVERMTRTLADALVRVDASYARREDRLMSMVESSTSGLKSVALGRATGDAEVWRELVEARSEASALASMAMETPEESGGAFDMSQIKGLVEGLGSVAQLKQGAQTGQLLTTLVVQLSEGKGIGQLSQAVKALSPERRKALGAHLLPLLAG